MNSKISGRAITAESDYRDKLSKLIPSEIIAAYITIEGILKSGVVNPVPTQFPPTLTWGSTISSIILFVLTPFYLKKLQPKIGTQQIIFTTLSFAVWVYCLGGPFEYWSVYFPMFGSIGLILWTLLIPFFIKIDPS